MGMGFSNLISTDTDRPTGSVPKLVEARVLGMRRNSNHSRESIANQGRCENPVDLAAREPLLHQLHFRLDLGRVFSPGPSVRVSLSQRKSGSAGRASACCRRGFVEMDVRETYSRNEESSRDINGSNDRLHGPGKIHPANAGFSKV